MAQNIYRIASKCSLVYIHAGATKKSANLLRQHFLSIQNDNMFQSTSNNISSVLSSYKAHLKNQLKFSLNGVNNIDIDTIDQQDLVNVLDGMASELTKRLQSNNSSFQQFWDTASDVFQAKNQLNSTDAINIFVSKFDAVLAALNEFTEQDRTIIASVLTKKMETAFNKHRAYPITDQDLKNIQNKTQLLSSVQRSLNTFLQNYAQSLQVGIKSEDKKSYMKSMGKALGNLLSTDFGELAAAKSLVVGGQIATKEIQTLASTPGFQLLGTESPKDNFGGMGKTDIKLNNIGMSIEFNESAYQIAGNIELSVKTYLSKSDISQGISISIQNSNSLIKRIQEAYPNLSNASTHSIYNTLAFSQAKTAPTELKNAAAPAYRMITKSLLESQMLQYLAGSGTGFKGGAHLGYNFTPFIVINGKVYSTLSILIHSLDSIKKSDINNSSADNLIYISASTFDNEWEGEKSPNLIDAQKRSNRVKAAIEKISMVVHFNLTKYLNPVALKNSQLSP